MDMEIIDVQNICRVCLNHDKKLSSLFDTAVKDKQLCEKLIECASIIVAENDDMPQRICEECKTQLIAAFQFRLLCQSSDSKLRQLYSNRDDFQTQCEAELYFTDHKLKLYNTLNKSQTSTGDCNEIPLIFIETFPESSSKNDYFITNYDLENTSANVDTPNSKSEFIIETSITTESPKSTTIGAQELPVTLNVNINEEKVEETENQLEQNEFDKGTGNETKERSINKKKQCQICGKMTTGLKLHMLSHMGIKDFKCEYCGKAFVQRIQYQRHLNIHTGNKPFVCTICGKAFADSTSLRCHNITHTKERKYKCDICEKSFGYSHTLTAHKLTHTQDRKHICEVCDRPFLTKHGLKKHTRTHTGEKPYKCDFCDKRFTTTGNIQTHRRIHTKERPYKCQICDMSFSYKSVLNTHGKIHKNSEALKT